MDLTDEQLLRYNRHIMLPEVDIAGQQKLLAARVLIIGLGGLGSPVAMYLASSGIGHLVLADFDRVDLSNLQRQIAHTSESVGELKVESAKKTLLQLNASTKITTLPQGLSGELLSEQVALADVVVDATDNFTSRYEINAACIKHNKPVVSGAAIGWEGQISVFDLREKNNACYQCLYPNVNQAEDATCARNGVMAPLVGIIGSMQALEAIKIILSCGQTLNSRLLVLDAKNMDVRIMQLKKDRNCLCAI
jgi:molybdopterin/thiamine biosynthesis adenylyltransferase